MKWLYNPPQILKSTFKNYQWESKTDHILFTFDDGPVINNTEIILKQLQKHSIKGMFFCVGNNVNNNPALAKEILSEGHSIGNHTYNHAKLNKLSSLKMINEINLCSNVIAEKLNYEVAYFRPPHGRVKLNLSAELKKLNLQNVMWSLLTYDYKSDIKFVKKSVQNYLRKNSIILLHDNIKSKNVITDAIDLIVEETINKNYSIGTPDECLK